MAETELVAEEIAILQNLYDCREKMKYCDVIVRVDGKSFNCHRVVLAASSGYFDSLFNSSFAESKAPEISLTDISFELFNDILQYLYKGKIKISLDNVYELLKTSDYFVIKDLKERCISFIERNPRVRNLVEICVFANSPAGNSKLATASAKHAALYFSLFVQDKKFLNLEFDLLESILKEKPDCNKRFCPAIGCGGVLKDDCYRGLRMRCNRCCMVVPSSNAAAVMRVDENVLLSKLCDWVIYNVIERMKYFPKLANYANVNSSCVQKWETIISKYTSQLRPSIEVELFVKPSVHVYAFTENGRLVNFLFDSANNCWLECEQNEVPFGHSKGLAIGEDQYFLTDKSTENYGIVSQFWSSKKQGQWNELQSPPIFGEKYAIASIGNSIYLYVFDENPIRSYTTWSYVDCVPETGFGNIYTFAVDWNRWFTIPPIPQFLYDSYFVVANEKLFVIGGTTKNGKKQNTLQCFDKRTGKWSQQSVKAKLQLGGAVCCFGSKIYIFEETYRSDTNKTRIVHVYDTNREKWQVGGIRANVSFTRVLISFDNRLWAIPQQPSEKIEVYDPKLKSWDEMDNVPCSANIEGGDHEVVKILDAIIF